MANVKNVRYNAKTGETRTEELDLDTGLADITDYDGSKQKGLPIDQELLDSLRKSERQQKKAERLEAAIVSLSGAQEITALDFDPNLITDNETKKAVRQLRSRLNDIVDVTRDLRVVLRDLVDEDA